MPDNLSNVIAIAAGGFHSLALKIDGTVAAWGRNTTGQSSVPAGLSNVVGLAGGTFHSMALGADGSVAAWGSFSPIPSLVSNVTAIASGGTHNLVALGGGVPLVTVQPFDQAAFTGTPVTLHVRAAGVFPLTFQWRLNGSEIPGATNASLFLTQVQLSDAGRYSALVSNAAGSDISKGANLTVLEILRISNQPESKTVLAGQNATFSVAAIGVAPLRYQWRFNGMDLAGATNSTLNLSGIQAAQAGAYTVLVSDSFGQILSEVARLDVQLIFAYAGGQLLVGSNKFVGSVTIEFQAVFPNGSIFYTLDGSAPSFGSRFYTGPFVVSATTSLRAIVYSADFSQSAELEPAEISIVPLYSLSHYRRRRERDNDATPRCLRARDCGECDRFTGLWLDVPRLAGRWERV